MVGSFSPYTVKRHRVELVGGYFYRFFQCSFPCGIVMLVLSILFLIVGATQLIYINHLNGCNTLATTNSEINTDENNSLTPTSSSFKCNRQTMRVLGITGSVLFLISVLITKYSRSSEENNVIRAPTSSLLPNNTKTTQNQPHHPSSHYYHTPSSSINDQNNIVVSIR
jgi:hypothetical protein